MERKGKLALGVLALTIAGGLVFSGEAEALPPPPEGPILPYHDPGKEYPGRVDIPPLPSQQEEEPRRGGGGQNNHRDLMGGGCGETFMCEVPY